MSQDCIKPYPIHNTLTLYDSLKVLSKETKEKYKKQVEHIKGIQI